MNKFTATLSMLMLIFSLSATQLDICGNFLEPLKPGWAPKFWNKASGSKGDLEFVSTEIGNAVMLTAEPKGRFGIYSKKVAAKAGDKIKVTANVRGEKIVFTIFQYSDKTFNAPLRKELKSTIEGKKLEAIFTIKDTPKGKTDNIRIAFFVENDSAASLINVKAYLLEK
jgi:hypothetical protein